MDVSSKYFCWKYTVLLAVIAGCASPPSRSEPTFGSSGFAAASTASTAMVHQASPSVQAVSPASYQTPANIPSPPVAPTPTEGSPISKPLPTSPAPSALPAGQSPPTVIPEPTSASTLPVYVSNDPADPFCGKTELSVEQLVAEVEARNPSLQAASAAWRAAAERYPQQVSLDDPMFTYMVTPTRGLGADNGGGFMEIGRASCRERV